MSNAQQPYLKTLGFSESETAMVWLAGPLAGMFGQPVFGVLSDHCRSSWGKRKPFIVGGSVVTMVCMPVLAWAADLSRYRVAAPRPFGDIHPRSHEEHRAEVEDGVDAVLAKVIAAISIYILFVAMQAVQVGVRSLPVDQAPPHQQPQASLWGSRMCAFGAVTAGLLGFIGGATSFKFLAVVSCTFLLIGIFISLRQREHQPHNSPASMAEKGETPTTTTASSHPQSLTLFSLFGFILTTLRTLPPVTRRTCQTQLFSWFAWFIILQYTSTYISTVSATTDPSASAATAGTLAGLLFNSVSLGVNIVLPSLIALLPLARKSAHDPRPSVPAPFLSRLWQASHLLLACCMFGTHFAGTTASATALFGVTGVVWAVSQWVPFALITKELSIIQAARQEAGRRGENRIGTVLGVHIIASTFLQVVSAFATTGLLRVTEALGVGNGVGVALQLAAVGALGAAVWGQWRWRECVKAGF
ncbi:major facilitator superfamily domain-containing protein [Macrophomina phaseolina]|uniref:Major facilitator superfamily domain-containing protein n=1 Tax=Macrophomina phaseolina TaxID=35725 RepID=A0ABQ8GQQ9_9PEZI|nr:major facilitator superfamily domain-containing protein [Macrophomina phaseolina]